MGPAISWSRRRGRPLRRTSELEEHLLFHSRREPMAVTVMRDGVRFERALRFDESSEPSSARQPVSVLGRAVTSWRGVESMSSEALPSLERATTLLFFWRTDCECAYRGIVNTQIG